MPTKTLMPDDDGGVNEKIKRLRAEIAALEEKREDIEAQARELVAAEILNPPYLRTIGRLAD
jgi:hypothetical protein